MKRIFGLDIMRAIAIMAVVLCHTMSFFYSFTSGKIEVLFNFTYWALGSYGVEIFFVLSGFLIGNIFIRNVVRSGGHEKESFVITDFWLRRWIRTLPNYYLFVFINIIVCYLCEPTFRLNAWMLMRYLLFFQYILPGGGNFFGVSWSLAVEEWFYILLPVLFIIALKLRTYREKAFQTTMMLLLLLPTGLKLFHASHMPLYSDVASLFHYGTIYKLDSIFYGLLFAWMWNTERHRQWLLSHKKKLLAIALFSLLFSLVFAFLFVVKPVQNSALVILYAPVTSIAIMLFLPFLYEWKVKENVITRSVTWVSLISYSLYLSHVPVLTLYKYAAGKAQIEFTLLHSIIAFVVVVALSVFFSYLLYRYFEHPIMDRRNKIIGMLQRSRLKTGSLDVNNTGNKL